MVRGCVPREADALRCFFRRGAETRGYGWRRQGPADLDFEGLCEARNREISMAERRLYRDAGQGLACGCSPSFARLLPAPRPPSSSSWSAAPRRNFLRGADRGGPSPACAKLPGIELAATSDQVLEDVYPCPGGSPGRAGYIGVEFASIFQALGAETALVLRGDLPCAASRRTCAAT